MARRPRRTEGEGERIIADCAMLGVSPGALRRDRPSGRTPGAGASQTDRERIGDMLWRSKTNSSA